MTTVGYGDVVAVSPFGRIISIINALWGAFIISLLVSSISNIFHLSDNQKQAIAEITNSRAAAASIRKSIQYFNAKKEYQNNNQIPMNQRTDYVPNQMELQQMREEMVRQVDEFQAERKMNEELMPDKDQKAIDIEIVKEQILDLNDKFDYLMYVLMKDRRLENKDGDYQVTSAPTYTHAINKAATELEELEVKDEVKNFEKTAKKKLGQERKRFRKATPRQPLYKRIQEIRLQELENEKMAQLKHQLELESHIQWTIIHTFINLST